MKLKSNSSIIQYKPIEVKKTAEKVVDALVHLRNLSFSGECEQRDGVEFREDSRAESFLFFLAYREREGEFEREKSQGSDSIKRRESDRGNGGRERGLRASFMQNGNLETHTPTKQTVYCGPQTSISIKNYNMPLGRVFGTR